MVGNCIKSLLSVVDIFFIMLLVESSSVQLIVKNLNEQSPNMQLSTSLQFFVHILKSQTIQIWQLFCYPFVNENSLELTWALYVFLYSIQYEYSVFHYKIINIFDCEYCHKCQYEYHKIYGTGITLLLYNLKNS